MTERQILSRLATIRRRLTEAEELARSEEQFGWMVGPLHLLGGMLGRLIGSMPPAKDQRRKGQ